MKKKRIIQANKKALKGILNVIPILAGMLLLVSMFTRLIPKSFYTGLFNGNIIRDSFVGSFLGSALTGNPISAYVLGDGFINNGVSLIAVTAFIASWTTVGLIQLPAESLMLGKKFAIYRNISAFFISIIVAIVTVLILKAL